MYKPCDSSNDRHAFVSLLHIICMAISQIKLMMLFFTGPGQSYPAVYPASSYYSSAPPTGYSTMAGHSAPPAGKIPVSSTDYSGNYYQNSSGPSLYAAPPGTQPPAHQYSTSNAPVQPFQQTVPYTMSAGYYGQAYSHPSQGQPQAQPQPQPSLVAAPSGNNLSAPLYPIVSYPSGPGSSQYGTLRSSQTGAGQPPASTVMPPPPTQSTLQQYSLGNGATPTPAHPSYGAPPLSQTPAVNGQSNAGWLDATEWNKTHVTCSYQLY